MTPLPDPEPNELYARAMKAINDFELDALQVRRFRVEKKVAEALGLDEMIVYRNRLHVKQSQIVWLARYAQTRKHDKKEVSTKKGAKVGAARTN